MYFKFIQIPCYGKVKRNCFNLPSCVQDYVFLHLLRIFCLLEKILKSDLSNYKLFFYT
jgi:hypothetical protein